MRIGLHKDNYVDANSMTRLVDVYQPTETSDGEGGYTGWGKLLPAETSLKMGGLPLGLAHNVKVVRPVKKGQSLCWADVAMDTTTHAWKVRNEMERLFANPIRKAA